MCVPRSRNHMWRRFSGHRLFSTFSNAASLFSLCWVWSAREAACVRSFEDRSAERRAHSKAPTSQPATTRSEQKTKTIDTPYSDLQHKNLGNLVQIIGPCAMIRQTFVFSETALQGAAAAEGFSSVARAKCAGAQPSWRGVCRSTTKHTHTAIEGYGFKYIFG